MLHHPAESEKRADSNTRTREEDNRGDASDRKVRIGRFFKRSAGLVDDLLFPVADVPDKIITSFTPVGWYCGSNRM